MTATSPAQQSGFTRILRDIGIIALHEGFDALRSRRALVLLLLFLLGSIAGTLMSIRFIQSIEKGLANVLQLEEGTGTGGTTAAIWKNASFRRTVTEMVGDPALAESLLNQPPLSLFYCVIAFFFTPLLITLTAAPRLAEEVWSGSVRFVLFRTSRPAWCIGKFAGQALLLLAALLISVPAAWICGWIQMTDFPVLATLIAMLRFAIKAWIYGLAYLGLASGISLIFRSPGVATAAGLIAVMIITGAYHAATHWAGEGWWRLLDAVPPLTPRAYYLDLLRPEWGHSVIASASLALLGLGYLALGYLRFARRDL